MKKVSFCSRSRQETVTFAKNLAKLIKNGTVIGFCGDLGSGKTTFIKGLAKGLGISKKISSPSFVILKVYPFRRNYQFRNRQKSLFYHFDLYRLNSIKDLRSIGYEDFLDGSGVCAIEWANKAKSLMPESYLKISMKVRGENLREINLLGYGKKYENLIDLIKSR
jgi:tRNA threonylcarbamoyladenosine biosynthesis protein TsaE